MFLSLGVAGARNKACACYVIHSAKRQPAKSARSRRERCRCQPGRSGVYASPAPPGPPNQVRMSSAGSRRQRKEDRQDPPHRCSRPSRPLRVLSPTHAVTASLHGLRRKEVRALASASSFGRPATADIPPSHAIVGPSNSETPRGARRPSRMPAFTPVAFCLPVICCLGRPRRPLSPAT